MGLTNRIFDAYDAFLLFVFLFLGAESDDDESDESDDDGSGSRFTLGLCFLLRVELFSDRVI